jgi:hypothetical protein
MESCRGLLVVRLAGEVHARIEDFLNRLWSHGARAPLPEPAWRKRLLLALDQPAGMLVEEEEAGGLARALGSPSRSTSSRSATSWCRAPGGESGWERDQLESMVRQYVDPESFDANPGCRLAFFGDLLLVAQTPSNLAAIRELLAAARRAQGE